MLGKVLPFASNDTRAVGALRALVIAFLFGASSTSNSVAKTEHCMLDGDDVRDSFFFAPTRDATPATFRLAGHTYRIPRNYFSYPQMECRTGESRGFSLRMLWPDLSPAMDSRTKSFVRVYVSPGIVPDLNYHMRNATKFELPDAVEPIEGLSGFASGMTQAEKKIWDHYYAPSRNNPGIFVRCKPYGRSAGQSCALFVPYRGVIADIHIRRQYMPQWKAIVDRTKEKLDSFIVK